MTMASPTFEAVSGMAARRMIEPGSAASEAEDEGDMPRHRAPMPAGPERDAEMVRLYQAGKTNKEIREAVGLSYDSAIYLALQRAGMSPTRNAGAVRQDYANGTAEAETNHVDAPRETEVPVTVALTDMQPEGTGEVEAYVLRVEMLRPVVCNVEVDVSSFDEAVAAAHALPGLFRILGVARKDAMRQPDTDGD